MSSLRKPSMQGAMSEAAMDTTSFPQSAAIEVLDQLVTQYYDAERRQQQQQARSTTATDGDGDGTSPDNISPSWHGGSIRSIRDLDLTQGKGTFRPSTTKLEVLEQWKGLVQVLQREQVFAEYVAGLKTCVEELMGTRIESSQYRNLRTLVGLLEHTATNHKRDNSTECRFVTLLEVMLTYNQRWTPSSNVSRLWVRLMQRIPADIPAINFRRKAYRVLVSLSWVPSSKGLLEACSFEEQRQHLDPESAPYPVRQFLSKIRNQPLPRYDCVNQLLDRLKDETDVCVAITSAEEGGGKTTLAALVASHSSILRVFSVLWLPIKQQQQQQQKSAGQQRKHHPPQQQQQTETRRDNNNSDAPVFTYEVYLRYLNELCEQIGEHGQTSKWPAAVRRFEEPGLAKLRDEELMKGARDIMSSLLLKLDVNVLLILDDVGTDGSIIEWFRFNERQSIICTTAEPNLEGVDWTVELDPMCPEEAIELFLQEANFPNEHILGSTDEVVEIVKGCDCNPLAVRSIARWYKLKQVTAGIRPGIEEIINQLRQIVELQQQHQSAFETGTITSASTSSATGMQAGGNNSGADDDEDDSERSNGNPSPLVFDILSLMMGPSKLKVDDGTMDTDMGENGNKDRDTSESEVEIDTSALFVLCFAALAVVFEDNKAPLDAVLLLWGQVLKVEPHAKDELGRRESGGQPLTDIELRRHAWFIAEGLTHMGVISVFDSENDANPWVEIHHKLYREFAMFMAKEMDLKDTFEETCEEWNRAFVTAYFEQRIQGDHAYSDDNSWEYAVEKLPGHMLKGSMFPLTETILSDENFFRARIESLGWDQAIDLQIKDCVTLQRSLEKDFETSAESLLSVSAVFNRTAALAATQAEGVLGSTEVSFVVEVSRALFKIGFALAENGYFEEAITQFDNAQNLLPQSQSLRASILYGTSWATLAVNESEKALKKIKACKKVMEDSGVNHVLWREVLLLQGDALFAQCEYKEADECFAQLADEIKSGQRESQIELGTTLIKQGRLLHVMGELEKAKDTLTECVEWKLGIGELSRNLSMAYGYLGDIYMELRQVSDARENYENALQTLNVLKYDRNHVDHLLLTGKLCFLKSDFNGGVEVLEEARQTIAVAPLLLMDQSAYDLRGISRLYLARGDVENAVKILHESLLLTNERPHSLERSSCLLELGNSLLDKGEINSGLMCLEQSLEIRILKLGECMQVLDTLKTIGNVHLSVGSAEEALKVFVKVRELRERISPNDFENVAGDVYSVGEAYDVKGDADEAVAKFTESIDILRRDGTADHPDIAKALQHLGDISALEGEYETAEEHYSEALRIRRMYFQENLLAETLHSLGVLYRKQGEPDKADEFLLDALEIRKKFDNVHETAETLLEIGNCYRGKNKPEDAMSLYEKGLEVLDSNDEYRESIQFQMGHVRLALGNLDEALTLYRTVHKTRLGLYGKDDMKTANAVRSLGLVKYLLNKGEEAMVHLNEFIRVCEQPQNADTGNTETVDYILAVMLLGDIYSVNQKMEQADNVYGVAKEIWDEDVEVHATKAPALLAMLGRRLDMMSEREKPVSEQPPREKGSGRKKGLLSMIKDQLSEEVAPTYELNLDPAEVDLLQRMNFCGD